MKNRYFKKFWNETTGDAVTDSWGNSKYYFETDEKLNVLKQIQLFENENILKYDEQNFEDQYGFLTDHPLEIEDYEDSEISEIDFYEIWNYKFAMELSKDFKSALRHFVYYYTNGTLPYVIDDNELLKNINYREDLKDEASLVEKTFAIFSNNIRMDESGKVLNLTHSMKRAAQWIRFVCREKNDTYQVEPEFEDWEVELH
ncbi:DUF7677 family protein [Chryseobacterium chendengshani]|uniref:DUF7677 family protein n=1 Tax=Chryseobacterium sp. LJ756 TaxID=2864113 RepID=UPI001C640453|nr:hypothetical protein [Chryseobacterium sp. LJ756]MBW7674220.1 hypothetical protein [Chryseobacterium sp. LJ756]